jgi:hypothetical protein
LRRVRRLLTIVLVLAWAAPAAAAPRPLAYTGASYNVALAGDHAFADTPDGGVISVPTAGGAVTQVLPGGRHTRIHELTASPQRAAIIQRVGEEAQERSQLFAGPPFAPLSARILTNGPDPFPFHAQFDGDRLFSFYGIKPDTITVRDPQGAEIAFPPTAAKALAVFNADLVAYPMTWTERDPRFEDRRLVVADWRTGTPRYTVDLADRITRVELAADGRVLATIGDAGDAVLYDVSAAGVPRFVSLEADDPHFAGEHIVFERGDALYVLDPSGRTRRFGVTTDSLTTFTTDATRVLWVANGCLLVADVTDAPVTSIGPGPCPRGELEFDDQSDPPPIRRNVPVRLHCIAAPRNCTGELQLRFKDRRLGQPRRIGVPAGRRRTVMVGLSAAEVRALEREDEHERLVILEGELRVDGLRVQLNNNFAVGTDF